MPMTRSIPAADPDAYVAALTGWRRRLVEQLRAAVARVAGEASPKGGGPSRGGLAEVIKWGHIVWSAGGPVLLIRAEERRVLFGFWRGGRLRHIEPRLKPGGKYEMATLDLREGDALDDATAVALVRAAVELNRTLGDPTDAAPGPGKPGRPATDAKPPTRAARATSASAIKTPPSPGSVAPAPPEGKKSPPSRAKPVKPARTDGAGKAVEAAGPVAGKVLCRTPTPGGKPTRIAADKFERMRRAILDVVPAAGTGAVMMDLPALVAAAFHASGTPFPGSVAWYFMTVKLELEVRGDLVRVPGSTPQRLRRRVRAE